MAVGELSVRGMSDGVFLARPAYFGPTAVARPDVFGGRGTLRLPIGVFVVRAAGRVVLVDAGLGPTEQTLPSEMTLTGGALPAELRRAGLRADDITDVVVTHLHSDHVGWLFSAEGSPVFGNASIWFGEGDWEWFVTGAGEMAPHIRHGFLTITASRLRPIDSEVEMARGVAVVPTPGHTPGHLGLRLYGGGQCVWLLGDAITHPVQLIEPTWHSFGDVNARQAHDTRAELWSELRQGRTRAAGAHFPDLAFGTVVVDRGEHWVTTPSRPSRHG
jgi:glyoxylase-like metal-dependent hydrolase (beta-lactamase superfamily II)